MASVFTVKQPIVYQQLTKSSKMNFTLVSPGDSQYHKVMMKKHLEQKKRLQQNSSLVVQSTYKENEPTSPMGQLPRAGKTLLNSCIFGQTNYSYPPKPKEVNVQNQKMKRLIKDQLQESLNEQHNKKANQYQEQRKIKKVMSVQNGMLDYLERQIEKRDNFIKQCLVTQQKNKQLFIDEDKRKGYRVENHVLQNYDPHIFSHEAERYQRAQKQNMKKVVEVNGYQTFTKKVEKQQQKSEYTRYLDPKYVKERHNPITNPMQYHIENPYIMRRISKY